jgi:hypothetical protein
VAYVQSITWKLHDGIFPKSKILHCGTSDWKIPLKITVCACSGRQIYNFFTKQLQLLPRCLWVKTYLLTELLWEWARTVFSCISSILTTSITRVTLGEGRPTTQHPLGWLVYIVDAQYTHSLCTFHDHGCGPSIDFHEDTCFLLRCHPTLGPSSQGHHQPPYTTHQRQPHHPPDGPTGSTTTNFGEYYIMFHDGMLCIVWLQGYASGNVEHLGHDVALTSKLVCPG